MNETVTVTKPFLPPLEEYTRLLEEIWASRWLTNQGQFHQRLETALAEYLGVPYVSLCCNGTVALILALRALNITGEVITTPFSFVATAHALAWNGIEPVFCDIEPETMTLDPAKAEALITPRTSAIMPVHVYGYPCRVEAIQELADLHGLKVIYDAAHAFGVRVNGRSILEFGDLAVLSFHATKVFTTGEGGAIVCRTEGQKRRLDLLRNFGFVDEVTVVDVGINGKMDELSAALGLLELRYFEQVRAQRREIVQTYRSLLADVEGIRFLEDLPGVEHNYAYFPIFVDEEAYGRSRDGLYEELKRHGFYARRYFYPLISRFPPYKNLPSASPANLPVAERIAKQVLCLPVYPGLSPDRVEEIVDVIVTYKR
jgi:dTDP-4-amino-4,6-dideoxygalactose transaminase